jgi:hypothetical protein
MEIFETIGIHGKVTKRWQPATDEMLWLRDRDGMLTRTERLRTNLPNGVRCVPTR